MVCLLFIHPPAHGSEVSPAARNTLDSARIPRASKLLICGLFQKVRVLAQDGVDAPAQVLLDGEEIKVDKLRERLELWSFTEELKSPLSFRSIIRRFIRSGRGAYNEFAYTSKGDLNNSYGAMTGMAFLLGLDTELARAKYELRQRQTRLKKTMAQLESDPLFSKLLAEDTVDIELMALKEDAARLSTDLSVFKVAHDYHGIEKEANNIKRGLNLLRRESVKLTDAIAQIDRSLKAPAEDLPPERVARMCEEAQIALPDGVKRRLEEVVAFRDDLQRKRVARLTQERRQLSQEQSTVLRKIDAVSAELDRKLSYLSEHRALDEYLAVSKQLAEVQERIAKLEESDPARVLWTPTEARQCAWRRPWESDDEGSSRGSSRRKRSGCSKRASAASARSLRNWT